MNLKAIERLRKYCAISAWGYFGYMAYMLLSPRPYVPKEIRFAIDIIHLSAFFVLGFVVGLARKGTGVRFWFVLLAIWSVGSECLQILTGRYFEVGDIVQNLVGVTIGLTAATALRRYAHRHFDENGQIEKTKK